jgi:hypothetical protein
VWIPLCLYSVGYLCPQGEVRQYLDRLAELLPPHAFEQRFHEGADSERRLIELVTALLEEDLGVLCAAP